MGVFESSWWCNADFIFSHLIAPHLAYMTAKEVLPPAAMGTIHSYRLLLSVNISLCLGHTALPYNECLSSPHSGWSMSGFLMMFTCLRHTCLYISNCTRQQSCTSPSYMSAFFIFVHWFILHSCKPVFQTSVNVQEQTFPRLNAVVFVCFAFGMFQ